MNACRWNLYLIAVAALAVGSAMAQPAPLSERVVAYQIDATYDPAKHSLEGSETLTYTNRTGVPLEKFPFHLYLNAFQPKSTWMTEAHRSGWRDVAQGSEWKDKQFGSIEVKSLEVVGQGDLTKQLKFVAPDDGNADDRTVTEVALPHPIASGESVQFRIRFVDKFPEVVARTGYKRDFLLAGQWFPKVGVWWHNAWNCHQFHSTTEFFADFGTYDVNLTLPAGWNVGATGVETARHEHDGVQRVSYHADDVHDFAWTADPHTVLVEDSTQLSTGPVKIRMLMQPENMASAARYMSALKGTMQKFDEWIGPYPYPQITVVDPPHGGSAAGGMEYPMFITADTSWWMPKALLMPEVVVEHEFGHQYWYGMVATNEFENAWMDEGINQYFEAKVMDALYGRETSMLQSRLATGSERGVDRLSYVSVADYDPLSRNGWQYLNMGSYGGITYNKTALVMLSLEGLVGEKAVLHAFHDYFQQYKFKHPGPAEFTASVNASLGQNLDWYWKQAIYGTEVLDDRVLNATSQRMDWYSKDPEKKGTTSYFTSVIVQRRGNFDIPVVLEVKFDDGSTVRETWDGHDRWHRFSWERKAKLASVEIDPDHVRLLDRDPFNNSYVTAANGRATGKIAGYWTLLTQWLASLLSWLA